MTLIYYIKDNSLQLDIFGLEKKRKWENVTTSSFVDGQTIALSHSKRFFSCTCEELCFYLRPSFYTTLHCVTQSIDVRTYYTSILLITRLNNLETWKSYWGQFKDSIYLLRVSNDAENSCCLSLQCTLVLIRIV